MRVIINADDFGYSPQVNEAIEKAIISKKISSTTIMANAPYFVEAVSIAKKYDCISYGVHLNLIEFQSLSNNGVLEKYQLIDQNGNFIKGAIRRIKEFPRELTVAIKEEWTAQINTVIKAGIRVSHIDSHQHTHNIPALQDILLEIMDEFGIKKCRRRCYLSLFKMLRSRKYVTPKYSTLVSKTSEKHKFFNKFVNHIIYLPLHQKKWISRAKKNICLPDEILSYQWFVQDIKNFSYLYSDKTIELECHPGLMPNLEETNLLMQDEIRKYMPDYILITYCDLV